MYQILEPPTRSCEDLTDNGLANYTRKKMTTGDHNKYRVERQMYDEDALERYSNMYTSNDMNVANYDNLEDANISDYGRNRNGRFVANTFDNLRNMYYNIPERFTIDSMFEPLVRNVKESVFGSWISIAIVVILVLCLMLLMILVFRK